jgi:hypothetical protein
VQKDEYLKDYYPYFPEAKQRGALAGEDFYRLFVGLQKIKAVQQKINNYKGKIITVVEAGEPEQVIKTGAFNVLRRIPIKLIVRNSEGKEIEITDNDILGAVAEKDNKYKLLTIFE